MRLLALATPPLIFAIYATGAVSLGASPPPVREFLIFFASKSCAISPEADEVLETVAAETDLEDWKIAVVGHADRAGSSVANQQLSECRADATKNALAAKGVKRNLIAASGRGESEPMVPTADGVREPQNRRVAVMLQELSGSRGCRPAYPVRRYNGACANPAKVLERVAECARSAKSVVIAGHTTEYSDELKRALMAQGIPESAIAARGGGPDCAMISIVGAGY